MKIFEQSSAGRKPRRNVFDLSHERKLTMNMGDLVPCYLEEVVPGEKFRVNSQVFLRFLALIAPVMHRVNVSVHYFFVPNRLLWTNWPNFITQGESGTSAPAFPTFKLADVNSASAAFLKNTSLLDYLGFPTMKTTDTFNASYNNQQFSALPIKAYQLIYDQYYRDQNVTTSSLPADFLSDGLMAPGDCAALFKLQKRAWEKDFFTSCLPFTQRGNPVSVPITSNVTYRSPSSVTTGIGGPAAPNGNLTVTGGLLTDSGGGSPIVLDNIAGISSSSLTVNALRLSVRLQEWLEKNARGGGRYIEQILAHFGVLSSDARLQRAEFLGGGMQPVVVSEVLQTSTPAGGTPLATMAGHAMSVGSQNGFKRYFEEHGLILGLISVTPKTAYQDGVPPQFWRQVNTDFYFPEFAHLGEQNVNQLQIYFNMADGASAGNTGLLFGYQSRYAEYKYKPSQVSGMFKESLSYWHLGRIFAAGSVPALNTAFIECSPRQDIFATPGDTNHIVCQIFHSVKAIRPMPYFGTPQL